MITCGECGNNTFDADVEIRSHVGEVDQEGGMFVIPSGAFVAPDFTEVYVVCRECRSVRPLSNSEWSSV